MREKPIIFSAPMVIALLAHEKTETRRVINPQPHWECLADSEPHGNWEWRGSVFGSEQQLLEALIPLAPYQVGDRLWARETWRPARCLAGPANDIIFKADCRDRLGGYWPEIGADPRKVSWRPSIFMPKKLARIWLEVTGIGAEPLDAITPESVTAEGLPYREDTDDFYIGGLPCRHQGWFWGVPRRSWNGSIDYCYTKDHLEAFRQLWDSINRARGYPFEANYWVYVYTLAVTEPSVPMYPHPSLAAWYR